MGTDSVSHAIIRLLVRFQNTRLRSCFSPVSTKNITPEAKFTDDLDLFGSRLATVVTSNNIVK